MPRIFFSTFLGLKSRFPLQYSIKKEGVKHPLNLFLDICDLECVLSTNFNTVCIVSSLVCKKRYFTVCTD